MIHLGGESSKTISSLSMSRSGAQLTLWRMRAALLYYRKHHGSRVWLARMVEEGWHLLRAFKARFGTSEEAKDKRRYSLEIVNLMRRAWQDTSGGRVCPPRPW